MSSKPLIRYRSSVEAGGYFPPISVATYYPAELDTITDPTIQIPVRGWSVDFEILQRLARGIALQNHSPVSVYDSPRLPTGRNANEFNSGVLARVVDHVQAFRREKAPIDLRSYSAGSIPAAQVARNYPHAIRSMGLAAPAGLSERMTGKELIGRALRDVSRGPSLDEEESVIHNTMEQSRQPWGVLKFGKSAFGAGKYVIGNALTVYPELCATAEADILEPLIEAYDSGVATAIITLRGDGVYPQTEILSRIESARGDRRIVTDAMDGKHAGVLGNLEVAQHVSEIMRAAREPVVGVVPVAALV
ncbi:MAG: hypothetical protein JWL85_174 [Candidatus Saccharibacteria bacterium]|nr:hypothetical protein [Candidatus Saccharibacteria bacterium]